MSRTGQYALLFVSLAFVAAGIGMAATGAEGGWPAILFFGVCAAVATWQLWPRLIEGETKDPGELLAGFPGPVILRMGRGKPALLLAATLVFWGVLLWLTLHRPFDPWLTPILWAGVAVTGLSLPLLALLLVNGASLVLTAEGFEARHVWRRRFVRWRDIGDFSVGEIPPSYIPIVIYDDVTASGALARANAAISGRNAALPDSYGLAPEDLAELMNGWRGRALSGR